MIRIHRHNIIHKSRSVDIIAYAKERHIEIIPEIDMPGHATAANKAYPEYSGGGTEEHPEFTFNVGKEETYTYLTNILKEIAALFPSPYLHIGGDEVLTESRHGKQTHMYKHY